MGLVRIGKVVRPVGLKGLLGVAGSAGSLGNLGRLALERPGVGEEPVLRRIVEARPQGKLWVVQVEGVDGRGAAEAWVGGVVAAPVGGV